MPEIDDSEIWDLLDDLNTMAQDLDGYEFGLPMYGTELHNMISTVRDWLKKNKLTE